MSPRLAPLDVAVVVLYLVGTTVLGAWFTRRQRDLRTYFVGDRNVGWFLVLISIVATETSTVTFLSVPGVAFNPNGGNLTFLQLAFGYVVGRLVVAWLLLPQYLRGELFSAYQLLRQRFSPGVQRTASGLFLLTRTVADGLRLYLTALLLGQFTGWDMTVSIGVMGVVTVVYTYLGGMQAVIWTDLIQFVIYILGAVCAGVVLLHLLPGGLTEFVTAGSEAGKFTLLDFSPDPTRPYTFWAGVIGGAFFTMASHGADQIMVQRYLCSRSLGQARAALVLSGVVVLLQFLLFLLIGVGLYALHHSGVFQLEPGTRNDEVFGAFIVGFLPRGLVGLVVAAVLAAAMSTLSSSLNSSANAFVSDFYRPLRPGLAEGDYLRLSRGMTAFWGAAQMAVALAALYLQSNRSVVDQVLSVAGFTTGMVLGLFLLGSLRWPVRSGAALAGLVVGFLAVLLVWAPSALPEATREELSGTWGSGAWPWPWAAAWVKGIAWPWYAPLGATVTVAVALLINYLWTVYGPPADGGKKPGLHQPG
jgi:solute:Na+ symporter, SSS family